MTIRERLHSDGVQVESTAFAEVVDFADQKWKGLPQEKEDIYYTSVIDILAHSEEQIALMGKDMIIAQSKKDIMILVSGLKAGIENRDIQSYRAEFYQYKGILWNTWPFDKLPKVDLDPSKNGFPTQIAMGVVDEILFSLWDIGYDLKKWMESGEIFTTIQSVLREVMSWNFLRELWTQIGVGVMDLLTNFDNTKGDIVYRKTRQLLITLGIVALIKLGAKVAVKKIAKMTGKSGKTKSKHSSISPAIPSPI